MAKSHIKLCFSILRCEFCLFFLFSILEATVLSPKTQGPSQTLRQEEGCLCPMGSSQSCCCPTVRPPDRRTEGVNARTRAAAADGQAPRDTHGRCVRRVYVPLTEAFPVEALEPPAGQRQGCHDYCLSSQDEREAPLLLMLLNVLNSVFLISNPLRRIVPENHPHRKGREKNVAIRCQFWTRDNLQSLLMRVAALLVIFLGNSIMSMPLRMML